VAKKQIYLRMLKKKAINKNRDLCPVCDTSLYYDGYTTQRIGILSDDEESVEGWMCPHCKSEFDNDNNLVYIYTSDGAHGTA